MQLNLYTSNIKKALVHIALPCARFYIRYSPFDIFKQFLWSYFYWRDYHYCVRTRFGTRMKGRARDLVQGRIYYFGIWEPNLSFFIVNRLRGGGGRTFVDVGANVGYYSLLAAKLLTDGRVVAIEAFPSIHKTLVANVKLNKFANIRTVAQAATDKKCHITMFSGGPLNEGATSSAESRVNSSSVVVEGMPLSEILADDEISTVRLIKIDVEGAEHSVIKGMESMLSKLPSDAEIVVEISPSEIGEKNLIELFSIFKKSGYFPYTIKNIYVPNYYLFSLKIERAIRMKEIPTHGVDIVFSRMDAEYL